MAKNMALLENGVVTNLLWCSDSEPETEKLIDYGELGVAIGDSYQEGKFYRNGQEIISEAEALQIQNSQLLDTIVHMVDEVYQSDIETLGI